jgi:hypothetical protein
MDLGLQVAGLLGAWREESLELELDKTRLNNANVGDYLLPPSTTFICRVIRGRDLGINPRMDPAAAACKLLRVVWVIKDSNY